MVHILCAKWTFLKAKRRRHNDGGGQKISSLVFVLVQRLVKYTFSICASPGIGVVQALIIFNGHWRLIFKFKVQIQNRGVFSRPLSRGPHVLNIYLREFHFLVWSMKDLRARSCKRTAYLREFQFLACFTRVIQERSVHACATSYNRTASITLGSIGQLVNKQERG